MALHKSKRYLTHYWQRGRYSKNHRHNLAKELVDSIIEFREHKQSAKLSIYIHIADIPLTITNEEIKKFIEKLEKIYEKKEDKKNEVSGKPNGSAIDGRTYVTT